MSKAEQDMSIDFLRCLLDLDDETGILRWKRRDPLMFLTWDDPEKFCKDFNRKHAITRALCYPTKKGYRTGYIFGRPFSAHRVIFAMTNGYWPEGEVDHDDGDCFNDRPYNLKDVTQVANSRNKRPDGRNTSGRTGVTWAKRNKKWRAKIVVDGRTLQVGYFTSFEEACAARKLAEQKYGFHPNHGIVPDRIQEQRRLRKLAYNLTL